jgi:hypothetical protein
MLKKGFKYMDSDPVNNVNTRYVGPCEVEITQTMYDGNLDAFEPLSKSVPTPSTVDLSGVSAAAGEEGGDGA